MTLFETLDIMAIHCKIMDLYNLALKDFEKKNGVKFTTRSRKLLHEIAVMCNNCVTLRRYNDSESIQKKKERCLENQEPEEVMLNMIIAVTEGATQGDKALTYITPMLFIPLIDEMLERKDRIANRNAKR